MARGQQPELSPRELFGSFLEEKNILILYYSQNSVAQKTA